MEKNATWRFIAFILFPLVRNSYHTSTPLPGLSDLCPYTNVCTHQAINSLDDTTLQSCCLPCSCDEDCGIVDKCCPDVARRAVPAKVYPCREQDEIYASYLNIFNWQENTGHSYRIIDSCPVEAVDNPDLSDSVAHCSNASEIQDLIFVTGTASGFTYLNKHCAICNDEYVYTEWALNLINRDLLSMNMSFEERDRRILSEGGILSIPPTHTIAMDAFCMMPLFQRCNVTSHWDFYDETIEKSCNDTNYEYISEEIYGRFGYANVYCFICNNPTGTPVRSECKKTIFDATLGQRGGLNKQPFSALITAQPPKEEQSSLCPAGEVLDPYQLECTNLFCQFGTAAQRGVCTSIVEDISGLGVLLTVKVLLDSNVDSAAINYDDFADDLQRLIKRNVKRGNIRCGMCSLFLYEHSIQGTIYMSANLLTTVSCSVSELLRGVHTLFPTTSVSLFLPTINSSSTFLTIDIEEFLQNQNNYLVERGPEHCSSELMFNPIDTIYCPSIQLSPDNLREFTRHGTVISLIMSKSVQSGNGTVRICMTDYISILTRNQLISGIDKRNGSNMLIAFTIVVVRTVLRIIKLT